jgi:hypothetical protein
VCRTFRPAKSLAMTLESAKKKYIRHGPIGVFLFSAGMSLFADGIYRRVSEVQQEVWIVESFAGLVAVLMGLAFMGSAVRYVVHMDRSIEYADRRARKRSRKSDSALRPEQESAVSDKGILDPVYAEGQ